MKLKSLLIGLLTGAGLGILFAPKKGKELRSNIIKERKDGGTGLEEITSAMKESATEAAHYSKKLWDKAEKFIEEKMEEEKPRRK